MLNLPMIFDEVSWKSVIILKSVTILSVVLQRWLEMHFLRNSKLVFVYTWLQYLYIIFLIQIYHRRWNFEVTRLFSTKWFICCLYGVVTIANCYDITTFTRKSSGTEFYQTNLVFIVPVLVAVMHWKQHLEIPLYIIYALGISTVWKMVVLFKDFEFQITSILSCECVIFVTIHCLYLFYMKLELHKTSSIETIYHLSTFMMLVLPLFIMINKEFQFVYIKDIPIILVVSGVLALTKFMVMCCGFWLIKYTDPLTYLLTYNVGFIAEHFMQALVYKFDCTLSASKICFLLIFDFGLTLFREYPI